MLFQNALTVLIGEVGNCDFGYSLYAISEKKTNAKKPVIEITDE